jgi:hypothetical protein
VVAQRDKRTYGNQLEQLQIAEYGVTVGGVYALAGDTQIIRLWRRIRRLRRPSLMPRAGLPLSSILLQRYRRPRFVQSAIRPPETRRER